ncbi:YqhA family protein [Xanthobacter sp. KR7-65]|uniref:YqhA family protein n=1 Tax=Xanthobacter sp. KR7-65 TaxID=3156612 RepID=UPI0032B57B00
MRKAIVQLVTLSRWAMVPLFAGLAVALALLVVAFLLELVRFAIALPGMSETQVIMGILTLIDLALVGGLLVVVISSGYENFVEKIDRADTPSSPVWMTRISFSGLKLKLFASLMAITGITLLKALMRLETDVSETQVRWLVVANVIFVAAYAVLALTDRFHRVDDER